jgi:hypothetical protein
VYAVFLTHCITKSRQFLRWNTALRVRTNPASSNATQPMSVLPPEICPTADLALPMHFIHYSWSSNLCSQPLR